jgi:hypothetical protein
MNNNIHFEIFQGLDEHVYQHVAPYAMTMSYIKRNGNPITTSDKHSWYIGFDKDGRMVCFCSVKSQNKAKNMQIGNLFIFSGERETFDLLIRKLIKDIVSKGISLAAYANNENKGWFATLGFKLVRTGVNWHNMKYHDSLRSNHKKI